MQYGKILRSPHPYAKIEAIDVEKAKAYPGVTAVVTWKDVDPNIYITNGFTLLSIIILWISMSASSEMQLPW